MELLSARTDAPHLTRSAGSRYDLIPGGTKVGDEYMTNTPVTVLDSRATRSYVLGRSAHTQPIASVPRGRLCIRRRLCSMVELVTRRRPARHRVLPDGILHTAMRGTG